MRAVFLILIIQSFNVRIRQVSRVTCSLWLISELTTTWSSAVGQSCPCVGGYRLLKCLQTLLFELQQSVKGLPCFSTTIDHLCQFLPLILQLLVEVRQRAGIYRQTTQRLAGCLQVNVCCTVVLYFVYKMFFLQFTVIVTGRKLLSLCWQYSTQRFLIGLIGSYQM